VNEQAVAEIDVLEKQMKRMEAAPMLMKIGFLGAMLKQLVIVLRILAKEGV